MRATTRDAAAQGRTRRRLRGGIAFLTALLLGAGALVAQPALAAEDSASLQVSKSVVGGQTVYSPGDAFQYEIEVGCSSTNDDLCVNAALADALPAPLVFDPSTPTPVTVSLSPSGPSDLVVDKDAGTFTVTPKHTGNYEGAPATGLSAGGSMLITVSVQVPTTVGGDYDGATITNTAKADADNALPVEGSTPITLDVETTLAPSLTKSSSAATIPAVPGRAVDWTLAPGNASNQVVDIIVVQDPASPPADFDGYLDVTGVDVTAPAGSTGQSVEYFVAGAWTTTEPADPAAIGGVRVTFTGEFAPGAKGEVVVHTVSNETVSTIPTGQSVTVVNNATSTVAKGGETSEPVEKDASVNISATNPDVSISKVFDDATLVSGQSTVANVIATNGAQDVQTLTVTEPSAGQPGFAAQGLTFDGFGDALAWPADATSATITYTGPGCSGAPQTTTTVDTLPALPAGCTVDGFTVTFTAPGDGILASSYATLPLEVTALPRQVAEPLQSVNHVDTVVENSNGQKGTDDAEAPFTVAPLIVDTEVSKSITPSEVWGVPGADANISLSGKVSDSSTIGAEYLKISDPVDPTSGEGQAFWNAFRPTAVENTDIPQCTSLTLNYWSKDAGAWVPLPGAGPTEGPVSGYSFPIPAGIGDLGGIQYVFEPTCQATLPPGFTVITTLDVEVAMAHDTETVYTNDVQSEVDNKDSVVRKPTDEAEDQVQVNPIDGEGPDFVDKTWLRDTVPALSDEVRTARLGWSTQGLKISDMTITDPASPGELVDVRTSVYDAFDLVQIPAITPATDPLIAKDVITSVELYLDGQGWKNVTTEACTNGCDGQFGGFDLEAAGYADSTLGVRITFSEGEPGAGVGSSYDRRPLDLNFRIRDTLRSDPSQYVLGTFHPYTYNTGDAGLVNNTVNAHGVGPGVDHSSDDADTITITDSPINVDLTKSFDQTQLGLPQPGTAPDDYPLITAHLAARNMSAAKVSSIEISDPGAGQTPPTAFDVLDLHSIDDVTVPEGLSEADGRVQLTREDGTVDTVPIADATALTPAQLADVVGVTVTFAAADGRPVIVSGASVGLDLTWQLREEKRSGGPVEITRPGGDPILNEAHTFIDSPGRIACPGAGCSTGETTASDRFDVVAADYTIRTQKTISPASVAENGSKTYTTTLRAQPQGSARTTLLTLTDDTPTFWNTMDFTSVQIQVPRPVNQLRLDVLVGVTYELDGGTLTALCDGQPLTDDASCWKAGMWTPASGVVTLTPPIPYNVQTGDIVGVRMAARQVDATGQVVQWERPYNPTLSYRLTTERRDTVRSDPSLEVSTTRPGVAPNPGEIDSGVISDEVRAVGRGQFGPSQTFTDRQSDDASTTVTHLPNAIKVTKTRGRTPVVNPAGNIDYVITVTNTGSWPMTGFHLVDQIDLVDGQSALVEPQPAAYTFTVTGPGAPTSPAGFSASLDEQTGALTIVNADPDFVFQAGWTLTMHAPLRFRDGLSPDVLVHNTVTATSDRPFERCESTTTDLAPKPIGQNVDECSSDTTVSPRASSVVSMKKWVKGNQAGDPATTDDDLGVLNVAAGGSAAACAPRTAGVTDGPFYTYPCAPITRPGGEETWRLDFLNTGNTNAKVVAAIDTLPAVGDRGVIDNSARGSQFAVSLIGRASANLGALADGANATLQMYYSATVQSQTCNQNAVEVYTSNASPNPACAFDWQPFDASTPESTLSGARSVLAVVTFANPDGVKPGRGLHPGETLRLTFDTRTPAALPADSAAASGAPVAYNSFAGSSRTVATTTQAERGEIVLGPQKVGVASATGQLQLDKVVVSPDFASPITLPTAFPMLVTCTSAGQSVTLRYANGADASRVTVPVGTPYVYGDTSRPVNLPLFSTCAVTEDPAPTGAEVTVTPTSVTAQRDLSTVPAIHHPYRGDLASTEVTVTNTYSSGGFTVTKTVDDGGAVDQDGAPIVYDESYGFTATCTFLGQEAVPEGDRAFTLTAGQTKTFTGIPTGATCVVTETDAAHAASTEISVNGEPVDADDARFTIVKGETPAIAAAFRNVYQAGALEITKAVTGTGAQQWGAGPFTFAVVCTLPFAQPTTVYDGSVRVTRDDPVATIENLPAGAECAVRETDDAGATQTRMDPEDGVVTIAGGDTAAASVTVSNDFRTGALQVLKEVTGPGAPAFSDGPFVFDAVCTYESKTVYSGAITLTGDGTGAPLRSEVVGGLPVGSECVIRETDDGHADETPQPVTITIADQAEGAETVVTAGFVNPFSAGVATIEKVVDGTAAESPWATDATFTVLSTCQLDVDGERVTVHSGSYQIRGGQTLDLVDADGEPVLLPLGTHCFIAETVDGGASATSVNHASYDDAAVIVASDERQTLQLVATNTFDYAAFSVAKTLSGTAAADATSFVFAATAVCTLDQGGESPLAVLDETFTIRGGQTVRFEELPVGADCVVQETDAHGATSSSLTVGDAKGATARFVLVGDAEVAVTIDNRFDKDLPATGGDDLLVRTAAWIGLLLVLGGATLVVIRRRRREV